MKTRLTMTVAAVAMVMASCGGGASNSPTGDPDGGGQEAGQTDPGATTSTAPSGGPSGEVTPEASGPLEPNTIRIGDEVWSRTLPMTSGQCFLIEDDGTLTDAATAWGTLNGDDALSFRASYQVDAIEAQVKNESDMYWGAGPRFTEDDLVIELDFDNLTISGHGTFVSLITGEKAMGSFEFVCDPADQ